MSCIWENILLLFIFAQKACFPAHFPAHFSKRIHSNCIYLQYTQTYEMDRQAVVQCQHCRTQLMISPSDSISEPFDTLPPRLDESFMLLEKTLGGRIDTGTDMHASVEMKCTSVTMTLDVPYRIWRWSSRENGGILHPPSRQQIAIQPKITTDKRSRSHKSATALFTG